MTQTISLLGSTGSIGTQTLEVCRHLGIKVDALTCGRRLDTLERQIREFNPALVSVSSAEDARELRARLAGAFPRLEILHGREGNLAAATLPGVTTVVAAMVGAGWPGATSAGLMEPRPPPAADCAAGAALGLLNP